jgi:hypothetical protein
MVGKVPNDTLRRCKAIAKVRVETLVLVHDLLGLNNNARLVEMKITSSEKAHFYLNVVPGQVGSFRP